MRYVIVAATTALFGCGGPSEEIAANECPPGVTIVDGWTAPARAGQPVSAAYVTICNGGAEDDALINVANVADAAANTIEIHQSTMTEGVMSMAKVERVTLPAGQKTAFEPGGAHIMLIGVSREIAKGAEPTFTLDFENADDIQWAFEVRTEDDGHSGHH